MNVLYRSHPSFRGKLMLLTLAQALILLIISSAIVFGLKSAEVLAGGLFIIIVLVLLALAVGYVYLIYKTTIYTVTRHHVMSDKGIILRKHEECQIRKLQAIDVRQNIIEKLLLRTGTTIFNNAGGEVNLSEISFVGIKKPHQVLALVRNADSPDLYMTNNMAPSSLSDSSSPITNYNRPTL